MKSLILAVLLAFLPWATTPAAAPNDIWISLGNPAYALLQQIKPAVRPVAMRQIDSVPGSSDARAIDTIRVVRVSLAERDALARAVHQDFRHGPGFVAHDSLAAALASMQPAALAFKPTRPDYGIDQQPRVRLMLANMSAANLGDDIQALSAFQNRYYNGKHGAAAADWLVAEWQTIVGGRSDIHINKVYRGTDLMPTVVLSIDGTTLADQVLVMGAHLDSVNWDDQPGGQPYDPELRAPGADDDASGVAGLSEVLRTIIAFDFHPDRSIRLMAYSGEEFGLYGSQFVARNYASMSVDVVGVLQLDMTNYQGSAADIYLIGDYTDARQNQFLEQLLETYLPNLQVAHDVCGYACSDHASWNRQGYAASFPFEAKSGQDNPWIHSAYDTWFHSSSQATHALKFTRLAMAWLVELGLEDGVIFDGSRRVLPAIPTSICRTGLCPGTLPVSSERGHHSLPFPHR